MIGDDIVLSIEAIRGDQVRIGISAPREIRVDREEVFRRIEALKPADEDTRR